MTETSNMPGPQQPNDTHTHALPLIETETTMTDPNNPSTKLVTVTAHEFTRGQVAFMLRRHAGDLSSTGRAADDTVSELLRMADLLDGGVGEDVHHGCPDPAIPTAECTECRLVLHVEAPDFPGAFTLLANPNFD